MKNLLARKDPEEKVREKAATRMDRLSMAEILDWSDAVGSGVARNLQDYRRHADSASLAEARQGVLYLLGCLDVLERRAQ